MNQNSAIGNPTMYTGVAKNDMNSSTGSKSSGNSSMSTGEALQNDTDSMSVLEKLESSAQGSGVAVGNPSKYFYSEKNN